MRSGGKRLEGEGDPRLRTGVAERQQRHLILEERERPPLWAAPTPARATFVGGFAESARRGGGGN